MDNLKKNDHRIVIVDDVPKNIQLIGKILLEEGFLISIAQNGNQALEHIAEDPPDLILLDIVMPDLDGYEVCRRLKKNSATRNIPVIFMSALSDTLDKVKGFDVGAVDYITKPVKHKELIARVNLHLTMKLLQENLEEQVLMRTEELVRKNTELRSSEEKYRSLVETINDWIWEVDENAVFTYTSPKVHDLLGYAPEQIIGKKLFDLIPPEEVNFTEKLIQKFSSSRRLFSGLETVMLHKNGRRVIFEVNGMHIFESKSKFKGYRGVSRDITKRKYTETKLLRLASAINQSGESIIVTTADGTIEYANPAFEIMTGYTLDKCINKSIWTLQNGNHAPDLLQEMQNAMKRGKNWSGQLTNKRKDGELIYRDISISPILNPSGKIDGYVSIQRDVTKQLQMESKLRQAQKMESIGTLAGGIAHDFNNILSAIIGYADISKRNVNKKSSTFFDLQQVIIAGIRGKNLVKQILTFSRQKEQELRPVQVNLIVKEVLKLLRASLPTTVDIHRKIASDSLVMGDPTQIHQVLMNLCTNSWHAMQEKGGELSISLNDVELDSEFVIKNPEVKTGPHMKLTVSDTGSGIPDKFMHRIFDPFFTTKTETGGTGLGLSVVHGIVKNYGGTIAVYNNPRKGTTFDIFLPILKKQLDPLTSVETSLSNGTERILLVDDEKSLAVMGKRMLESIGYEVVAKTDSTEALALFTATPDNFDLVITDMTMPKMKGEELGKKLMKIKPNIPIILCTGFTELIDEEKAEAMGFRQVIFKPILIENIATAVRNVLDNK